MGNWIDKLREKMLSAAERVNKQSVILPAVIFALAAVCAGLIISSVIDRIIAETAKDFIDNTVRYIGDGYRYANNGRIGKWFRHSGLEEQSYSLGMTIIWLLSCLGGVTGTLRGQAQKPSESVTADVMLSLGIAAMVIIPVVSLLAARFARRVYIKALHPGKEIQFTDGTVAAAIFTFMNVIVQMLPKSLEGILKQGFDAMGDFEYINAGIGANTPSLAIFSFILAFIIAGPGLKSIDAVCKDGSSLLTAAYSTSLRYLRLLMAAGLLIAAVAVIFAIANIGAGSFFNNLALAAGTLVIIPNAAIWLMPLLSGGSAGLESSGLSFIRRFMNLNDIYINLLGMEPDADMTVYNPISKTKDIFLGISGINMESEYFSLDLSWFGAPLIIAGVLLAVAALYKTLRNCGNFGRAAVLTVFFSSAAMQLLSKCAGIAVNIAFNLGGYGEEIYTASLSSASLKNTLLHAATVSIAILTVYIARKIAAIDSIVKKLATVPIALAAAAVAALIMCLTAGFEMNIYA